MVSLYNLSTAALAKTFSFLEKDDLQSLSLSCKRFYKLIHENNLFWFYFAKHRFPELKEYLVRTLPKNCTWREYVIERLHLLSSKIAPQNVPGARFFARFRASTNTVNGNIYVIGGQFTSLMRFKQLFKFDPVRNKLTDLDYKGNLERSSRHCAVTVDDKIYLFGGFNGANTFHMLKIFDTKTNTVTIPEIKGDFIPASRTNFSGVLIGRKIYYFGGLSIKEDLADLFSLDVDTMTFESLPIFSSTHGRCGHVSFTYDSKLYIYGGGCGDFWNITYNTLDCYDPQLRQWTTVKTTGEPPKATIFSNTCTIGNFIVFFPGVYESDLNGAQCKDNVYVLDMVTNHWFKNDKVMFQINNRLGSGSLAGRDYYFIDGLEPEKNTERNTLKATLIPECLKTYASIENEKNDHQSQKSNGKKTALISLSKKSKRHYAYGFYKKESRTFTVLSGVKKESKWDYFTLSMRTLFEAEDNTIFELFILGFSSLIEKFNSLLEIDSADRFNFCLAVLYYSELAKDSYINDNDASDPKKYRTADIYIHLGNILKSIIRPSRSSYNYVFDRIMAYVAKNAYPAPKLTYFPEFEDKQPVDLSVAVQNPQKPDTFPEADLAGLLSEPESTIVLLRSFPGLIHQVSGDPILNPEATEGLGGDGEDDPDINVDSEHEEDSNQNMEPFTRDTNEGPNNRELSHNDGTESANISHGNTIEVEIDAQNDHLNEGEGTEANIESNEANDEPFEEDEMLDDESQDREPGLDLFEIKHYTGEEIYKLLSEHAFGADFTYPMVTLTAENTEFLMDDDQLSSMLVSPELPLAIAEAANDGIDIKRLMHET